MTEHQDNRSHTTSELRPVVLLALAIVLFLTPFMLAGNILLLRDLFCYYYPWYTFYQQHLSHLSIPLWNPYTGCGEPFLANIETRVLYPPNLFFIFLPTHLALFAFISLHLFIAGSGTYCLCRRWHISREGALMAAIIFVFSTAYISKIEFFSVFGSYAWYPAILALFVAWDTGKKGILLIYAAGAITLQILAGYPEMGLYTGITLSLYSAVSVIQRCTVHKKWHYILAPFGALAIIYGAGALLAMAQILPTWEAASLSANRSGIVDPDLSRSSLHPLSLFTLFIPSLYGIPGYIGKYWAPRIYEYWLGTYYIGIIPLLILLGGTLFVVRQKLFPGKTAGDNNLPDEPRRDRTRALTFLLLLFVFSFLYALGSYTPFFSFVWHCVPLLQKFRWPAKVLMCTVLSLSCLTAFSFDRICGGRTEESTQRFLRRCMITAAIMLAGIAACSLLLHKTLGHYLLNTFFNLGTVQAAGAHRIPWNILGFDTIKLMIMCLAGALLLWACMRLRQDTSWWKYVLIGAVFLDLALTDYYLLPAGSKKIIADNSPFLQKLCPSDRLVRFFLPRMNNMPLYGEPSEQPYKIARDCMLGGWAMNDKAFNVEPQNNFSGKNINDILDIIAHPQVPEQKKKAILGMLNCGNFVSFPNLLYLYAYNKLEPARAFPVPDVLPRAYVVGGVATLGSREDVLQALATRQIDFLSLALTDQESAGNDSFSDLSPGRVLHTIKNIAYGYNRLDIELESLSKGLLVISDTYYPGWEALVNGRRTPIIKVNSVFRGIRIYAGYSKVELRYNPPLFRIGVLVSIGTLCGLLLVYIGMAFKHKRSTSAMGMR